MAPAAVTDAHLLEIWNNMNEKRSRVRIGSVKFSVGQHVSISKKKMRFGKGSETNYTDETFKISKVFRRTPRPVYVLEYLNVTLIEGQFYREELTNLRITKGTTYKIDKILHRRYRKCILHYLILWKRYLMDFDSWV